MSKDSYAAVTARAGVARSREFAKTPEGKEKIDLTRREVARIRTEQSQSQSQTQVQSETLKQ